MLRTIFYDLVEMITNMITGLDNTKLKLWNFGTWINTSNDVTNWLNVVCLFLVVCLVMTVITITCKLSKQNNH